MRSPASGEEGTPARAPIALWLALAAATLSAAGCYRPDALDCVVGCDPHGGCPRGMACSSGFCTTTPDVGCLATTPVPACKPCVTGFSDVSIRCNGNVALRCLGGRWTERNDRPAHCADFGQVCYEGNCFDCRPHTSRCVDGCEQPCNSAGKWVTDGDCVSCSTAAPPAPQIAAGWSHTCVLKDGAARCWGDNSYGQLGLAAPASAGANNIVGDQPGEVAALAAIDLGAGLAPAAIVAGGRHTCALLDDGEVKCWGANDSGQLGLGDFLNRGDDPREMGDDLPSIDLGDMVTVKALAAGGRHTCALLMDGQVKCWGANDSGQLGLGDRENRGDDPCEMGVFLSPVDLDGAAAVALVAGDAYTCALLDTGVVRCWGANDSGQLGLGDFMNRGDGSAPGPPPAVPFPAAGASFLALAAGSTHACALTSDGRATCFGLNRAGQIGIESSAAVVTPPKDAVHLDDTIVQLTAGADHTCALLDSGGVKCWGFNLYGQLGIGATDNRGGAPNQMRALPTVNLGGQPMAPALSIAAGGDHTCAVLESHAVKCWGLNAHGELGIGSTAASLGGKPSDMLPDVPLN